jgi:dTDP-4-amino-4,6-dideoxygalactose transaminase
MLTTSRDDWAAFARVASLHGMSHGAWTRYANTGSPHYDVEMPGYKYNMMDLQAAIGLHQLASLEDHWQRRDAIWRRYDQALADLPVTLPAPVPDGDHHARHLYTVLVDPESAVTRRADGRLRAARDQRPFSSAPSPFALRETFQPEARFPVAEMVSERTCRCRFGGMTDDGVASVALSNDAVEPGAWHAVDDASSIGRHRVGSGEPLARHR